MASVLISSSAFSAFVKKLYSSAKVESLVNFETPLWKALPKEDGFIGESELIPLELDDPQGISSTLRGAISSETSNKGMRWELTRAKGYASLSVDGETMIATRGQEGAWFKAKERNMDGILRQLGQQFEMMAFGDGAGKLGQLTADPGTGTDFTVSVADAINFHEGMTFNAYANSSGALGTLRTGDYVVSKVNWDTGVISIDTTLSSVAAIDAGVGSDDWLVRKGTDDRTMKGLAAWFPETIPSATFFGINRQSYSAQKVAGYRAAWAGSIEETVRNLYARMTKYNRKPKQLWISDANFNRLDVELGARLVRNDSDSMKFGASGLAMNTPSGKIAIRTSPYCPDNVGYLLDMDSIKIRHAAQLPHLYEDDGKVAQRIGSTELDAEDAIRMYWRWFAQMVCVNPPSNGRLAIS